MARGQTADALITSIRGLDLAPLAFRILLRRLLVAATNAAIRKEDAQAAPGIITKRQIAPARPRCSPRRCTRLPTPATSCCSSPACAGHGPHQLLLTAEIQP